MDQKSKDVPPSEKRLCSRCVGEPYLKNLVQTTGAEAACSYCESTGKTLSIAEVADLVDKAFEQHYFQIRTNDEEYLRSEDVAELIADVARIDETPTEEIRSILEDRYFDRRRYKEGGEGPFEEGTRYAQLEPSDVAYQEQWRAFEESLKKEARFFISRTALATLKNVFDGIDVHRTSKGRSVIVVAGKERRMKAFFRARVFQSDAKLKEALMRPDREIGPPDSALARAGRMNARGIAVFYGALQPITALAELRPPVGSNVVIGRFDLLRDVRLLDVDALANIDASGSVFDPRYLARLERSLFLSSLSRRITRPVLPDDEDFEYLVTQVIADYLATELKLDGVVYRSAQQKGGRNVALFHHAAFIEPFELPDGTEMEAHTEEDGEGVWRSFTVVEIVPKKETPPTVTPPETAGWEITSAPAPLPSPVLKLDLESIRVHEVLAAKYTSKESSVSRHRIEKRENRDF